MKIADIYEMKRERDVTGLLSAVFDANEYIRAAAVETLSGYPDPRVKEVLSRVKFDDPVQRVRDAATRAHLMVVQSTRKEKETE
jgi:HEAT repeat protein